MTCKLTLGWSPAKQMVGHSARIIHKVFTGNYNQASVLEDFFCSELHF